jgi:hypothetical protein
MTRSTWFHVLIAVVCALAVVLFLRVHNASGAALPAIPPAAFQP